MRRAPLMLFALALSASPASAADVEGVFAVRSLRAGAVVTWKDVEMRPLPEHLAAGVAGDVGRVVGREAARSLYANRPVHVEDLRSPTVVRRNALVTLAYRVGNVELTAVGRALDNAAVGEPVRVLNVDSRHDVIGSVAGPGLVTVGDAPFGDRP